MVIVRCLGPEEFFLERVVFPFELLSFLAPPQSVVEIWTHGLGGPELLESLDVACLNVERSAPKPLPEPVATATTGPWQQVTVNRWADAVSQAS